MGAWIEMGRIVKCALAGMVAPFMGAWIEMTWKMPTSGRKEVAPFMGAWIEIRSSNTALAMPPCRTLHGCVD